MADKVKYVLTVIMVMVLAGPIYAADDTVRYYKALSIKVKTNSATMRYHANYYVTMVSGVVGKEGIPKVISLGDKITVKDRSLTVNHIFVTEHLEDMKYAGEYLARKGQIKCVLVENERDLPHVDERVQRNRLWIHVKDCQPLAKEREGIK